MSLESLIGKEAVEGLAGKKFPINPSSDYERKEFVKKAGGLFDLTDAVNALAKDGNDSDASQDILQIAHEYAPALEQKLVEDPHLLMDFANTYSSLGQFSMAKYIEKNKEKVLDKLDEKQLYNLFTSVPLYSPKEGEGNKDYVKAVSLRDKMMSIQQALQNGGDPSQVLQGEVQELLRTMSEEQQIFIARNQGVIGSALTQALAETIQSEFSKLFRDSEGKLVRDEIKDVLEQSYKIAEDAESMVPTEKRDKYWDNNMKSQYLILAKELYKSEKRDLKREQDPNGERLKEDLAKQGLRI